MRVIINFIWLSLFLLGGGQHLHADTSSVVISDFLSFTFFKKEQIKLKTAEPGSVLLEEVGVDLDEEYHSSDDFQTEGTNKFIVAKNSLLDSWYLTFSNAFLVKDSTKQFEFFTPNCGYFSPIYLRIGVLRI